MDINVSWEEIKNFIASKSLSIQYLELGDIYHIFAFDNYFSLTCKISKSTPASEDQIDFENNFKSIANKNLYQNDDDGAQIVRLKAAKKGWSFWAIPIEFTTSTIGGTLYAKVSNGSNIPWINCKIYNDQDQEITDPGLLNANLATCVKTVIDFEPTFDFEIIGGALRINSNPSQDIRLWIVGAPDIPPQFGGSKEFASGVNLKFLAPDSSFDIDGRVTKFLKYDPITHQGKMRMILKHPAGSQINIQIIVHIYRE